MRFSLSESYGKRAQQQLGQRLQCHTANSPFGCTPLCAWMPLLQSRTSVEYTAEDYQSAYVPLKTRFKTIRMRFYTWRARKQLEALELVLLALRLNPERAWREIVDGSRMMTGVQLPWLEPFDDVVPHVCIEISYLHGGPWRTKNRLRRLGMNFARSVDYHLTRRWLAKCFAQTGRSLKGYTVPLTIEFPTYLESVLQHHSYLADIVRGISKSLAHSQYSPLRLDGVEFHGWGWYTHRVSTKLLHDLRGITTLTLNVHDDGSWVDPIFNVLVSEGVTIHSYTGLVRNPPDRAAYKPDAIDEIDFRFDRISLPRFMVDVLDPQTPPYPKKFTCKRRVYNANFVAAVNELRSRNLSEHLSAGHTPLKSLKLCVFVASEAFINLLQLVGADLECLSLEISSLSRLELEGILSACPHLRCLELEYESRLDIHSIIRAYEQGLCASLETLTLSCYDSGGDAGILALLHASNDPTSMVHHTLRDLEYKTQMREQSTIATQIIPLLEENRTLRHVRVWLPQVYLDRHREALSQLGGQRLPDARAPLPLVDRLALLSAVHGRLPADASRLVMEFSGGSVRRKVFFEPFEDRYGQ